MRVVTAVPVLVAMALAPVARGAGQSGGEYPAWDELSLRGFAQEVLFGYGMPRTPRFDDYTEGSYHVRPAELAAELPREAKLYDLAPSSLVVVGPSGILWSYDVIAFIPTKDCLRANWVLMAHARITMKKTGCLDEAFVGEWLSSLRDLLRLDEPPPPGEDDLGFDSCVLLAEFRQGLPTVRRSGFTCYSEVALPRTNALSKILNTLLPELELTYSIDSPAEE